MKKDNRDLSQVYDLFAVRVIVDTVKDCYGVLGIVHSLWKPLPASAGFSTDFSTSFSFPLHNFSTIPPAKNLSTSPRFLHKGFVEENSPQIPAKIRLSTFPAPL